MTADTTRSAEGVVPPSPGDGDVEGKLDEVLALLRQGSARRGRGAEKYWVLEGLRERAETPEGQVLLAGSVTLPTGVPYEFQLSASTEDLMDQTWSQHAAVLDALAHPVRLRLLEEVARGVRTTAELGALQGLGTSGQLHHHLRQLVTAGWLHSTNRGVYDIPPARVVPLLMMILVATS